MARAGKTSRMTRARPAGWRRSYWSRPESVRRLGHDGLTPAMAEYEPMIYPPIAPSGDALAQPVRIEDGDPATASLNCTAILVPAEQFVDAGSGGADHGGQVFLSHRELDLDGAIDVTAVGVGELQQLFDQASFEIEEHQIGHALVGAADHGGQRNEHPLGCLRIGADERHEVVTREAE